MVVYPAEVDGPACSVHDSSVSARDTSIGTSVDERCPLSVTKFTVDIVYSFWVSWVASSCGEDEARLAL